MKKLMTICLVCGCVLAIGTSQASILGSAESFAVLAGTPNITNTGETTITGNVGIAPSASITGKETITFTGTPGTYSYYEADSVALTAKNDLTTAYNGLAAMTTITQNLTGQNLGGLTLTSGVYKFDSSALLTGTLKLDAQGNNNAYWVFQINSTLTTGSSDGSSVELINAGSNNGSDVGVFWQVGSSAAIGVGTAFEGNILALTSITINTGATILNGRALAQNGTVTMNNNVISNVCPLGGPGNGGPGFSGGLEFDSRGNIVPVPEPATLCLLGFGALSLIRRKK
jgi:type VI secretion system secreted protein VgrG